ncbi:MAG: glycine cleavage system aminomethyltransferase GcvT [Armatimonadota bacterium]|nr:glycine cleavage system aminomethyltransferase GcvT [Armatimonadota bacterium]MDR7401054.1 glycine cleavage system aminomethyltransferase GcvT [Armatimonadota bacterium]MDR7403262.1 glycine cleavage system aminomethyltransferase GcvT [Armatimonadota bacterium]MDR7436349.1 glycine cleavage system aminomethyltransferase GcvT [Armatimonadota bacterium]MDR7471163.1 glycine cleavage system aminomethyltransferase GcvT [Armatimonadota bacterium]
MAATELKRTSLYASHVAAGARMGPFAGWEMPVQYAGIVAEHRAVRTAAGLFDVSHMGEIEIVGPGALDSVQRLITNDAGRLAVGQGLYTPMCAPTGGILDDLTVFRLGIDRFLMVVNASRTDADFAWIAEHTRQATARNRSAELALLALQGPRAAAVLGRVTRADVGSLRSFHLLDGVEVAGVMCLVSRTGYTGEDGFEIACAWEQAPAVWAALLEGGRPEGLVPAGLGARDTLRLEAGYMLYGQDIDETTTPLEAPLGWTVKFDKGEFIGRAVLWAQKEQGVRRRLVGFEVRDRVIARHGNPLWAGGRRVGSVTSGTFGPWVGKSIGMGYVGVEWAAPGTALEVEVRGRRAEAVVTRLPFYRRR